MIYWTYVLVTLNTSRKYLSQSEYLISIFPAQDELSDSTYSGIACGNADTPTSAWGSAQAWRGYRDFLFVRIKAYKRCIRKVFGPGGIAGVRQAC